MIRRFSGFSRVPSRQWTHSVTAGQVPLDADDPTTRPKWPALTENSKTSALGAARLMARTVAGRARSSISPMTARMGHVISDSATDEVADREATGHHPVLHGELPQQFGQRRPRPRDEAVTSKEPALALAGK